jgi:hypothetical protein
MPRPALITAGTVWSNSEPEEVGRCTYSTSYQIEKHRLLQIARAAYDVYPNRNTHGQSGKLATTKLLRARTHAT